MVQGAASSHAECMHASATVHAKCKQAVYNMQGGWLHGCYLLRQLKHLIGKIRSVPLKNPDFRKNTIKKFSLREIALKDYSVVDFYHSVYLPLICSTC
jgi:hypothetical protein